MILRPYQARTLDAARTAYASGRRAPVIVCPTGGGKTCMGGHAVGGHVQRGGTVNWYAHRRELLLQAADTMRALGLECGLFGEGASARVQLAMVQTAVARREVRACSLAVVDECHHSAADEWAIVPQAHKDAGALLLGLTATPERGDGRGLGPVFDHVVIAAQVKELIAGGALVPPEVISPKRKVPKGKLACHPVKAYLDHGRGRRNVVFCPNLRAAREWCEDFKRAGVTAEVVDGAMANADRDRILGDLRTGKTSVVLNVYVLTEGFDCPDVGVITIARPCGSTGMFIQMCGRGARPATGKTHYTLLDLRGVVDTHGTPDDDREYSLEGIGISSGSGTGVVGARLCKQCKFELGELDVCPRCGCDCSLEVPEDAGIDLARWDAKRAADNSPDKRAQQVARWMRKFPGKKPQFYAYRYKAVYGHWMPTEVAALATRLVNEVRD